MSAARPAQSRSRGTGLSSKAPSLATVRREVRALADPTRAAGVARFFKCAPGEYGYGDRFLGLYVPQLRALARRFLELGYDETLKLLRSPWHEERLLALMLLVERFRAGDARERGRVHRDYLANAEWVNNWDLVDTSAPVLVGEHLAAGDVRLLERLARSSSLWERRIAIVGTFGAIRRGDHAPALHIARRLLNDDHDLIHKAIGWMLREVGKRDGAALRGFLDVHAPVMPRTTLRYAIERFSDGERKHYMTVR